ARVGDLRRRPDVETIGPRPAPDLADFATNLVGRFCPRGSRADGNIGAGGRQGQGASATDAARAAGDEDLLAEQTEARRLNDPRARAARNRTGRNEHCYCHWAILLSSLPVDGEKRRRTGLRHSRGQLVELALSGVT